MDHQDWKPVVLRNPNAKNITEAKKKKLVKSTTSCNSNNLKGDVSIKKLDSNDVEKLGKVSKEDSKKIQQARLALKLSQQDLATKLNVKKNVINDLESGKMLKNNQLINKIKRVLKIK